MADEKKSNIRFSVLYDKEDRLFHVQTEDAYQKMSFREFHKFWSDLKRDIDHAWVLYDRYLKTAPATQTQEVIE